METVDAAVVGATGYLGRELVRLLDGHPAVDLTTVTSTTETGQPLSDAVPALAGVDRTLVEPDPDELAGHGAVLLATPSGPAGELVPVVLDHGTAATVVDLSGAHRLDAAAHADWYPDVDRDPAAAEGAVYGLPEAAGAEIAGADLIANPGCYPTGALLSALPAVEEGWADAVHVASVSGISGAGRTPTAGHHFPEANESVQAYGVDGHRHTPEIVQGFDAHAGATVPTTFVPKTAPMDRGIHTTAFLPGVEADPATIHDLYAKVYADAPFVHLRETTPRTKDVRGTNRVDVSVHGAETGLVVTAAHDNLVKGGAGQAVQNLNLALGLDEATGLPVAGGGP